MPRRYKGNRRRWSGKQQEMRAADVMSVIQCSKCLSLLTLFQLLSARASAAGAERRIAYGLMIANPQPAMPALMPFQQY